MLRRVSQAHSKAHKLLLQHTPPLRKHTEKMAAQLPFQMPSLRVMLLFYNTQPVFQQNCSHRTAMQMWQRDFTFLPLHLICIM